MHRLRTAAGGLLALGVLVAVAMTAMAAAKSPTLSAATAKLQGPSGKRTERIAVTGGGQAVYWLSGETSHHLLCTSTACLTAWPPVTAAHPSGTGLSGKLGTLRRKGFDQVTVNGHPVYRFIEDAGQRDVAKGDGVVAFGGTWHVFKEGAAKDPSSSTGSGMSSGSSPGY